MEVISGGPEDGGLPCYALKDTMVSIELRGDKVIALLGALRITTELLKGRGDDVCENCLINTAELSADVDEIVATLLKAKNQTLSIEDSKGINTKGPQNDGPKQ